jgi:hypothetical protein
MGDFIPLPLLERRLKSMFYEVTTSVDHNTAGCRKANRGEEEPYISYKVTVDNLTEEAKNKLMVAVEAVFKEHLAAETEDNRKREALYD